MSGTMTNPPPYDSAPTLTATQTRPPSPPTPVAVAARAGGAKPLKPDDARRSPARAVTSAIPHPARTRTSHGPITAAPTPPSARYPNHRARPPGAVPARRQLADTKELAALRATAGTAAPAPAAAPSTHRGGADSRDSPESPRTLSRPGAMKQIPPTTARG